MRTRLALVLAVTFLSSLLPTAGAGAGDAVSSEGVRAYRLPGEDLGFAVAINDSGWIALNTRVWKGVGYALDLWPVLAAMDSEAGGLSVVDMDLKGEVIGTYVSGFERSFLWDPSDGMRGIGQLTVTGIDDGDATTGGDIVGYYSPGTGDDNLGFRLARTP